MKGEPDAPGPQHDYAAAVTAEQRAMMVRTQRRRGIRVRCEALAQICAESDESTRWRPILP